MQPTVDKQNTWQSWQPKDDDLDRLLSPGFANRLQPNHPLMKLKRNLFINIIWGIVITLAYFFVIISTSVWPVQLALAITSMYNIIILVQAVHLYRSIKMEISSTESVLEVLKKHYIGISAWSRMQLKLAIGVYPIAAAGGYIYGGILSSGRTLEELMAQHLFAWLLPVIVIILVPIGHYCAKWMFRKSFGVYLDMLKATIDSMEE
ncbi:hypothetical protein [Flavihumibacter profundi]|uniref:hypothetical protein n=1 Tax=Flavihumibacter profundi TaxID=2716883 RepID=UPI001CC7AA0D|nr:hypothetical protein [Flavihumibacter profundi]MBZ5857855.1 hypothetical protein [Flavihumibacter profundi]